MKPTNAKEVRAFLEHRASERPRSEAPTVQIEGAKATLRLFDPVDSWGEWWGMSAKEFASTLDELPDHVDTIEMLINSPGGDAFEGVAFVNVMRAHPARTVAVVQGLAASAASIIACAADETVMAPSSTLMIHDPWGLCVGNADDMVEMGAMLDKLAGNYADIYAAKSGKSADDMRALMKVESWFTGAEAVDAGLADSVSKPAEPEPEPAAARLTDAEIRSMIAAEIAALGAPPPPAGEQEEPPPPNQPVPVDQEQASRLLATLTLNKETPHE